MSDERRAVPRLGGWLDRDRVTVRCWAPEHRVLECVLYGPDGERVIETLPMRAEPGGYFVVEAPARTPFLYKLRVDGAGPFPDPWSRAQPFGVHGPSSLDDAPFAWTDAGWRGVELEGLVVYELHVGTATREGTFDALIGRLPSLVELGVNAIELMPLAAFPGTRNWGYDGVSWFAPAECYGGPAGLRRLVDAAHAQGLAVLIDAVYNHFGPDGNYLRCFSPRYFTDRDHTPWGEAIDYSGCAQARELALASAEMWIRDYHADGLRLDATHEIKDHSSPHLLTEIAARTRAAAPGRKLLLIAENDRNDPRLVRPTDRGGHGLDAVWADDLHHQLRRAFAGDSDGYYQDYTGSVADIVTTLEEGWFYRGQYSKNLKGPRGESARDVAPPRFVHCIQNHDQIGNRPLGTRLSKDVSPAAFRAMSALLLFSPYTPLLFMGQEWNSEKPFLYFTDHGPELGKLVTEGRRREFKDFAGFHHVEVPDPQALGTFERSKLDPQEREAPEHLGVRRLYTELLRLRREHPALRSQSREAFAVSALDERALDMVRSGGGRRLRLFVQLHGEREVKCGPNRRVLHTEESRFGGSGVTESGGAIRLVGPCALLVET